MYAAEPRLCFRGENWKVKVLNTLSSRAARCKSVARAAKNSGRGDLCSLHACQKLMGSARALRRVEWNPNKRSRHFLKSSFSIKMMVMMMMVSFLLKLVWSWRSHWWLRTMPLLAHAQPMCCISQVYFSHVYFSGVFFKCTSQASCSSVFLVAHWSDNASTRSCTTPAARPV